MLQSAVYLHRIFNCHFLISSKLRFSILKLEFIWEDYISVLTWKNGTIFRTLEIPMYLSCVMWSASYAFHRTLRSPGNQHLITLSAVEAWNKNGLRPKMFVIRNILRYGYSTSVCPQCFTVRRQCVWDITVLVLK